MQLTKGAIGNLINRYKAVLKKCHLMNTFGSLAVAGMLVMGGAGVAGAAEDFALKGQNNYDQSTKVNNLMGGWLVKEDTTTGATGNIMLDVNGGTISEIIGGSYVKANSAFNETLTHGTITTTISGSTTSSQFVVGGSKIANSENARLKTGDISLTIKGGTFGTEDNTGGYELVMGGNYLKADKSAADKSTAQAGDISVKIEGGEFHASVVGGSTAHVYPSNGEKIPNLSVTDGSTSVTITGGTFNPSETNLNDANGGINLKAAVIGGGLAYGANTSTVLGSDTRDVTSRVAINGGEIHGKVVAGSVVANDGYSAIVHGDTLLSMSGGTVSDDLVGGGMVQDAAKLPATTAGAETGENPNAQKQPDRNLIVTGNAGVTVAGGTAKGEIVGGNYVRGNGSARVENSSVTITSGKFALAADSQGKAQYVIGGNKSMAYEGDTATTLVKGNSSVLVDGDVNIVDGAVVGGSMAKAEKDGKATATVEGNSSVTVNNATSLAGVVGGGLAETYSHTNGGAATSSVGGTSSVTINGGTIKGIAYGAVADNAGTSSAAVVGGGLANGDGSTATVDSTSVTIAGGTINGKVVAGGAAVNGGTTTVKESTLLTMTGGEVTGDLIGGNLLEKNGKDDGSIASTTVSVEGGTVAGEIYGGSYVRNTAGTSEVANTTVNISGGTIGAKVPQGWAQYVVGGGKAMSNSTVTESSVMGTAAVNISGGDITRGAVVGGGFARAQGANGSATANVEDSVVNLTGGTLVGVVGGGLAENLGTAGSSATATAGVTTASLTIGGDVTVNGIIYKGNDGVEQPSSAAVIGGGLAYSKDGSAAGASVGTANTTINGGTINGNVFAGGMADGASATANVTNANLTISGNAVITGNIHAGGYVLKGGTATVKNATVTFDGNSSFAEKVFGQGHVEESGTATVNESTLAFTNYNGAFNGQVVDFTNLDVAEGSTLQLGTLSTGTAAGDEAGVFNNNALTLTGGGVVSAAEVVADKGLTVDSLATLTSSNIAVIGTGVVTVEGTLNATSTVATNDKADINVAKGGILNVTTDTALGADFAGAYLANGGTVNLTGTTDGELTVENLQGKFGSVGIINAGDNTVTGMFTEGTDPSSGTVSIDDIINSNIATNETKTLVVTGVESADTLNGAWKGVKLAEGASLTVNTGTLQLTGDTADFAVVDGNVAFNKNDSTLMLGDAGTANSGVIAGDVTFSNSASNMTLLVTGNQNAAFVVEGDIDGQGGTKGQLIAQGGATLTAKGDITAGTMTADGSAILAAGAADPAGAAGDIVAKNITAQNGGTIAAINDVTVTNVTLSNGAIAAGGDLTLNNGATNASGALVAGVNIDATGKNLTKAADGQLSLVAGGIITANDIDATNVVATTLTASGAVSVDGGALALKGTDDAPSSTVESLTLTNGTQAVIAGSLQLNPGGTLTVGTGDDTVGGTTLSAQHIDLNGGMLLVDPTWVLASSNVAVKDLSAGGTSADPTLVNGSVGVGRNSYLALRTDDLTWLPGVVGNYTKGVGLSKDGITAALGVFDSIKIADTEGLVVDGSKTDTGLSGAITADTAEFAKNSLLVVNGANIYGDKAAITFATTGGGTLTVSEGAKLLVTDAVAGETYTIVDKVTTVQVGTSPAITTGETTVWKTEGLSTTTDMISLGDAKFDGTNNKVTTTASRNDAHTVFPNLSDGMANAVNDLYTGHDGAAGAPRWDYADVNSDDMGVRFLSRATDNRFLGADKDAAAATIESAARIAFAGAVPQMTKMASDAGTNAVVNRLGFANPADGAQAMDAEGKIVDRNTTGFALWIAPLWQSQHGWGMEADNLDYGFNGNLGGVSLGADYTFENAIRAGITFNIGGGYAESSGGDLNSTENNMSFWGLGAYAGWNYENFGLMADVSYTSTWNDLKQEMDGRMGMGDLEADVQASAISAGLRAEYKLETSVLDVIPHIGVRYMSLNTWGFDAESNGGTVLEGDGFHQDIWTFPVGVTFTKDFTLDSGWSFKPSIDFSVIPAAGDIKAKQDVAFTGLPGSYEVETQMMDYLTWQGGVGLEMGNDTMSFGVNYTLQAGQHTTGHGVFGSFRYEF